MKQTFLQLFLIIPFFTVGQSALKLWYQQPAKVWTEALPLGNGPAWCNGFWQRK